MAKRLTTEEFIKRALSVHKDTYDYNNVNYINSRINVDIICKKHGIFSQNPETHVSGNGCPSCSGLIRLTLDDFKLRAHKVHGDRYNYSKVNYVNFSSKVIIICKEHGEFLQSPKYHLLKENNCPKCSIISAAVNRSKDTEFFIEKSKQIHGDLFDYSLTKYVNSKSKVKIICKTHGVFDQLAQAHNIRGAGCPYCRISKGESLIEEYLIQNKLYYVREHRFQDCKDKRALPFDFYLPKHKTVIEFHGIQHYESKKFFGGNIEFKNIKRRDKIKQDYCLENNIKYVEINKDNIDNLKDLLDLDS